MVVRVCLVAPAGRQGLLLVEVFVNRSPFSKGMVAHVFNGSRELNPKLSSKVCFLPHLARTIGGVIGWHSLFGRDQGFQDPQLRLLGGVV